MPDFKGFPPELRLKKPAEFRTVLDERRRLRNSVYIINYKENHLAHPRLGFILSKHQIKHAHERNRVRRIVREAFRLRQNEIFRLDLVIMAGQKAIVAENEELRRCIDDLFNKLPRCPE